MAESKSQHGPPREILLATDLSPRCDRALDRAAMLARGWNARLLGVHALETTAIGAVVQGVRNLPSWRRLEDRTEAVKRELRADMREEAITADVLIEEGDPGEVVLRASRETNADLIVTGMARGEFLGRLLLGSTVDALVRQALAPVLVVKKRARRSYTNVVVATDFSDASRYALHFAVQVFADSNLTLFHAYHAPYASLSDSERASDAWAKMASEECDRFLTAAGLPDDTRRRMKILIEYGHPGNLLYDYCGVAEVDLVLIGAPRRGAVLRALVGSRAEELLRYLPCDVMAVPDHPTQPSDGKPGRHAERTFSA